MPKKQAEYGDASTLSAKINHHCLLLATRKTTSTKAPPSGAAEGVCSFPATPVSTGAPIYMSTAHGQRLPSGPVDGSGSGTSRSSSGGGFVLGLPRDSAQPSQPAARDPPGGRRAAPPHAISSVRIGAGHRLNVGAGGRGWESAVHHDAGEHRPRGHSSSLGETTEDDMNDDSVDGDCDGDDKYGERFKAPRAAAAAAAASVASASCALPTPRSAVSLATPPAAVPTANTLVQREQEREEGVGHEDEEEATEQARVEAVIAAASLGEGAAWNGGVQGGGAGGEPGLRQLLEGDHQPQSLDQQHPRATKAVSWHAFLCLPGRNTFWLG